MHGQTTLKLFKLISPSEQTLQLHISSSGSTVSNMQENHGMRMTWSVQIHNVYARKHVHARTHANTVDTRICVEKPRKCTKNARSQTETGNSLIRKAADYLNSAFVGSGISGSNPAWHISIQAAKFPKSWNEKRSHFHLPRWLVVTFVPNPRVHRCVCIALARALKFCCRRN